MRMLYNKTEVEELVRADVCARLDTSDMTNREDVQVNIYEVDDTIEAEVNFNEEF